MARPTTQEAPAVFGEKLDWHQLIEETLTMPGSLGNTYNRFVNYSFMNQVLLYVQGVREPVNTYNRWRQMDRQVIKGSKAKTIVRPIIGKARLDDGTDEVRLRGFKPVKCLFTVSETTGEELPPLEPRVWDKDKALGALVIRQVPFEDIDGNTAGYSVGRDFAINPVAKYPLKTTFHELGHIVLGHTTPDQLQDYQRHRGVREFQAEATAYIVMNELELSEHLDASESRAYVQHWLSDERPAESEIRPVFSAVDSILKAGWIYV